MHHHVATVVEHVPLAKRTYRIRLRSPEIASAILPGQFVMIRLPGRTDPLLGRPFALYDIADDCIDIVYLVVGKMTTVLPNAKPSETLELWGPLGKPFLDVGTPERVVMVAGGIGQTPFLAYAKHLLIKRITPSVELYYGVRNKEFAAGVDDFERAGVKVHLSSDDGSIGFRGRVTQLLESHGPRGPLVGCGPEPMLHALANLAQKWNIPCQVSLETPMACGVGACFSCVTPVKTTEGQWDYKRVCIDGPVFDACQLVWE